MNNTIPGLPLAGDKLSLLVPLLLIGGAIAIIVAIAIVNKKKNK